MATQPLTSDRLEFDDESEAIEYYFEQGWTDGLPIVPPTTGRVRTAPSEATETMRVTKKAPIHTPRHAASAAGARPRRTPPLVAIPFPPFSPTQNENTCPRIAAPP